MAEGPGRRPQLTQMVRQNTGSEEPDRTSKLAEPGVKSRACRKSRGPKVRATPHGNDSAGGGDVFMAAAVGGHEVRGLWMPKQNEDAGVAPMSHPRR